MTIPLGPMNKVRERERERPPRSKRKNKREEERREEECKETEGSDKGGKKRREEDETGPRGLESQPNCAARIIRDRLLPRETKMEGARVLLRNVYSPKNAGERRPRDRAFYFVARPQQNRDCAIITTGG